MILKNNVKQKIKNLINAESSERGRQFLSFFENRKLERTKFTLERVNYYNKGNMEKKAM